MKNNLKIVVGLLLLMALASCGASKKMTYFQPKVERKANDVVDIPSYRLQSVVRFKPDDVLGISVNIPGEGGIASDYNLPLIPSATSENTGEGSPVNTGMGRQAFWIKKDGNIDFPVIGLVKAAGFTQSELEDELKERLREKVTIPALVTVRLLNFSITLSGEVNRPGTYPVSEDNINLYKALALAGDMTIYGKRDNVTLLRQMPDGVYKRIYLDMSKEDIISNPYFFLQQRDEIYVAPISSRTQATDSSPRLNLVTAIGSFAMSLTTFILMLTKFK